MATTMQGSLIFGFIYSMVLIDEKDTNVAKVYGILPVSKFWFVIFRLIAPFLIFNDCHIFDASCRTFLRLINNFKSDIFSACRTCRADDGFVCRNNGKK